MRKHPDELAALIADRKTADLKAANVIWDTWTSGKWFESSEGKRFIHGEQSVGTFQNRLEVKAGAITGAEIKAKLAHKFESRIDWLALELVEPQIRTWSEGDERLINGRWRRLINGQWQEVSRTAADGNTIDKTVYGVDNLATLKRITSNPAAALSLSYGQLVAAQRDFPSLFEGQIKQAMAMAAEQEPKNQERVLRGTLIGINVQSLAAMLASTGEIPPGRGRNPTPDSFCRGCPIWRCSGRSGALSVAVWAGSILLAVLRPIHGRQRQSLRSPQWQGGTRQHYRFR
ncbi:hypothetical protein [Aeromonas hydrophila]|uniref:hypothetical protein n=1 Tax=Aeromonas hydrophila TaxID=644 RepID=UPI0024427881|nr:hypothetical protein [Aeromonas hydrophila]